MGKRQLSAEQWRVVSYLYHPDQLSKRISPSMAVVLDKQGVDRDAVIEVVERGLVEARVGGEECTRGPLKRLPENAIRLRLTRAGIYHTRTNPQHLVMCALRRSEFNLTGLMHLHKPVTFGELCEMADRNLLSTHLTFTDVEVPIRDVRDCPGLACARQTARGRTFVAYL